VLEDVVVVRGTVEVAGSVEVVPMAGGSGSRVVTGVRVEAGDEVSAGEVALEVGGRPVIVLPGSIPEYRDLGPGAQGEDVSQLQASLQELGFEVGSDGVGVFGGGTKAGVEELYKSVGYTPVLSGDKAEVRAAEAAVTAARRAVATAQRSVARLNEVKSAETQETAIDAAAWAVDDATFQLQLAREDLDQARHQKSQASSSEEKQAAAKAIRTAQRAQDTAARDLAARKRELKAARTGADPEALAARHAMEDAQEQVTLAREDLANAKESLKEASNSFGPMLPLAEYVVVPKLPAVVDRVDAVVGQELEGPALAISTGQAQVSTKVDRATRSLLSVGMAARVLVERLDLEVEGQVESIGEWQEDSEAGSGHPVVVSVPADSMPREVIGEDVRVTVAAASTVEEVLVVPVSAVFATADGQTVVVVADPAGGPGRRVSVSVGVSGDGFIEVTPKAGQTLEPGESVIVSEDPR
jgi:hypothetical protein